MTLNFEEFKQKALHPDECIEPGVYRVKLYNFNPNSSYPIFDIEESFEFYFPSFEEARQNICSYSYGKDSIPYCGYICFHKYGENASLSSYTKMWLFDTNGYLLDESLCPGTVEGYFKPFRGRLNETTRFKKGDIVEVIDFYSNTSSLAIIARKPLSIEQAWKINLKKYIKKEVIRNEATLLEEDKISCLTNEDDYYKVIHLSEDRDDYLSTHAHPVLIVNPHLKVSDEMEDILQIKLDKYQKNHENNKNTTKKIF